MIGVPDGAPSTALHALAGVVARHLVGPLGDREPLEPDAEAGVVHHGEHVFEAAVLLAHQISDGPAFAIGHDAGGAAVDAELVFQRNGAQVVGRAEVPSGLTRYLGTMKSEMPRVPGGASGVRASTIWTMLGASSWSP